MTSSKQASRILVPLLALTVMAGCGNNAQNNNADEAVKAPAAPVSAHQAHWSYEGDTSPEHWAELDELFTACSTGTSQSPVNIVQTQVKEDEALSPVQVKYSPSPVSILNNGHTIQVNLQNQDNTIILEGTAYVLQQFHFHLPSEHEVDGKHAAMELHLVHKSDDGVLAVVGVLITKGADNSELNKLWSVLPSKESEQETAVEGTFDINKLLPADLHSFRYQGSLTTPPCTEGVQWIVLENPVQWSEAQISAFGDIFPHDNRPVQHLGTREIAADQ
ncbi:carbonic anhydrase [Paenibacillus sp. PK3_47]|uniref:carbonic anhydrase n=1 Tax=Paenibacillus sp. PK3_47 TaxID=2072642 RepID=UPI00201D9730|nr:carbonic anhydrase family protein [Paenibacillus sp. PK3_47]UQZ35564.1 carbonic anhydrase [Paenibacillus sp. PK3_47]